MRGGVPEDWLCGRESSARTSASLPRALLPGRALIIFTLNVRLKDLLGPVTRVKKKKKKRGVTEWVGEQGTDIFFRKAFGEG